MKTLGMFAKQPVAGRVKTRLAADWDDTRAAALYECFVRDLLDRFGSMGDRRVVGFAPDNDQAREWFGTAADNSLLIANRANTENATNNWQFWPQPETDLGGRMAAFFSAWCCSDDDRTILIGSDSPSIPVSYLDDAWSLLDSHDCVIGPAADGGYWLIGFRGPAGRGSTLFDAIEWSSSAVFGQTVERIREMNLNFGLLPVWYDVDSLAAVTTLHGHLRGLALVGQSVDLPRTTRFLEDQLCNE
jgi:rSAM/selenodomain-associated transferase 1